MLRMNKICLEKLIEWSIEYQSFGRTTCFGRTIFPASLSNNPTPVALHLTLLPTEHEYIKTIQSNSFSAGNVFVCKPI